MKEKQKNDIPASKTTATQKTDFSTIANDICEENLVYLRIWWIGNNLPCKDTTNEQQFQSSAMISEYLSQDYCVTCIVSRVWTWERIQEEIVSILKQHLGCISLEETQNALQDLSYFYPCNNDKSQPQSIPLPTLPKHNVTTTQVESSSIVQNQINVKGHRSSLPSYNLYPIFNRMDFWNAIQPNESIETNVRWAVNMVVVCQRPEHLGRIRPYNQLNGNIADSRLNNLIPMKIKEPVGKQKYYDSELFPKKNEIISSPTRLTTGKNLGQQVICESTNTMDTTLQIKQNNDTQVKNDCEHFSESIDFGSKEMQEMLCSRQKIPKETNESNATKCKHQSTDICSNRRGMNQKEKTRSNLPSIPNDEEMSIILEHNHKTTILTEPSDIPELKHKEKAESPKKILAHHSQHDCKKKGTYLPVPLLNSNLKSTKKVKKSIDWIKQPVSESHFFHPYDVICYPKRVALYNVGNRRLEILIKIATSTCHATLDDEARSKMVQSVIQTIHESGGNFFRLCQVKGYVIASPFLANHTVREKVNEALVVDCRLPITRKKRLWNSTNPK